jgi:hypothetical protein
MINERQSKDIPPERAQDCTGGLAHEIVEKLADLALMSERHADLSLAMGEARQMIASLVERHPEFRGAAAELLAKLKHLEHLQATLGTEVMRYSHRYEDDAVGTP